jgi:cytochrome c biogenesis protein CcmG/thiol:disulfide interchange protein DsbE
MTTKKCPVCGVPVKLENLKRHVKMQHPREKVDLRSVLTEEETSRARATKVSSKPKFEMKRAWPLAVLAIIIVVVLFFALQESATTGIGVGQTAPEISLTTTDGNPIKLSDLRGKPTVLEFMDIHCGHCKNEAIVLAQVYSDRVTVAYFLSVDVNFVPDLNNTNSDDSTKINEFRTFYNTFWPYALDADGSVTKTYGVNATPKAFILDQNGVVRYVFEGEVQGGKATYEAAIDALL